MANRKGIHSCSSAVAATLLAVGLGACGSSAGSGVGSAGGAGNSSSSSSSFVAKSHSAITKLTAQAKTERKLVLYSVLAGDINSKLIAAFQREYPYIKVTVQRNDSSTVDTDISQQAQAGQNKWDVADLTSPDLLLLRQLGVLAPYYVPSIAQVPDTYRFPASGGQYWATGDNLQVTGFSWNTKRIPASAVPSTLEGLANPDLRGMLGTVSTDSGSNFVGAILHYLGQQKGMALLKSLSSQKINVQDISSAADEGLVASGVVGGSPTVYHDHYEQHKAKGAPLNWKPLASVALVGVPMIDKNAPDPAAAMLWVNFELGAKGQHVVGANGYYRTDAPPSFPVWNPAGARGLTAAGYEHQARQWKSLFQTYIQG